MASRIGRMGQSVTPRVLRSIQSAVPKAAVPCVNPVQGIAARTYAASASASSLYSSPNLKVHTEDGGVAVVTIDVQGQKMNTLKAELITEFQEALKVLKSDSTVKSVIIASGKSDNFIAGADINMLDAAKTAADLEKLSAEGQQVMDAIEELSKLKPVVAAVHGPALGGGLEVALACSYRVASSSPKTKLAVPEVMLGLLPGAGGTQRLPKVVGIQKALEMATTGKNIRPDAAKRMGLVDIVADPAALMDAALLAARGLADGSLKRATPKWKSSLMTKVLEGNPVGRAVLFSQAEKMIQKKAGPHYPAPLAIAKCIKAGADQGHAAGSKLEREEFGKLGMTTVSEGLRGLFFAQTESKKNSYGKPAHAVKTVGVLGAGLMGAGIAQVSAEAGLNVVLKDTTSAGLGRGEAQIAKNLDAKVKRRRMTQSVRNQTLSRVTGLCDELSAASGIAASGHDEHSAAATAAHFRNVDVMIEAVFEDLDVKHKVIKTVEPLLPEHAVFATNTSALPIADVAKAAKRPERVVGMHYFSPVDKMQLMELIPHAGTDKDALAAAYDTALKQGRTVVVSKDVPGFIVNRALAPAMASSVLLLEEGVSPEKIAAVQKKAGYPVDGITLMDQVGMDVANNVFKFMSANLPERMAGPTSGLLQDLVDAGLLGNKAGKGFYSYVKGKRQGNQVTPEATAILQKHVRSGAPGAELGDEEVLERLYLPFINEMMFNVQDGIVQNARAADLASVFGTGYLPYTGGAISHAERVLGLGKVLDKLDFYTDKVGPQFQPPQLLRDLVKSGGSFYKQ